MRPPELHLQSTVDKLIWWYVLTVNVSIIYLLASWILNRQPNHPLFFPPIYLLQSTPLSSSSKRKKYGPLNPLWPHSLTLAMILFLASAYSLSNVLSDTWCFSAISVLVMPTLPEHHFSTNMSYCKSDNPHTCFIAKNLSLHRPFAYMLKSLISSPIARVLMIFISRI